MLNGRYRTMELGDSSCDYYDDTKHTAKKISVVRKILAQLQKLLLVVEKRSVQYEDNRKAIEILQKALEEFKSSLKEKEEKLSTSIELIWTGIEETVICLRTMEEISDTDDKENINDVYFPCYSRLDDIVHEFQRRKTGKWKRLRNKLEILKRKREEKIPYEPGRQWEVVKFHFDSDDDLNPPTDDPFVEFPEKRRKLQKDHSENSAPGSGTVDSIKTDHNCSSEDDENFAKFLEIEAQRMQKKKCVKMVLKARQGNADLPIKSSTTVTPEISQSPPPVLQELSLNTDPVIIEEHPRLLTDVSISSSAAAASTHVIAEPVESVQPTSISNQKEYTGPVCETFEEMGLAESLISGINLWGILNPTPIEKKGIPAFLLGLDMVVETPTGNGKTTLASIAALNKIKTTITKPQAIFLLPSQDLAEMTMRAMGDLGTLMDVTHVCCKSPELLDSSHVFLGTPANTYNYIVQRRMPTEFVNILVVDAADEMLSELQSTVIKIIYNLSGNTQVVVLTRRLSPEIVCLSQKLRNPVYLNPSTLDVQVTGDRSSGPLSVLPNEIENEMPKLPSVDFENMNQFYVIVETDELKIRVLAALADTMETEQAIIFCNNGPKADWLARKMRENEKGLEVCSVHGGRQNHHQNDHLVNLFQAGVSRVLITTDFITRSNFRVKPVPLVLNYEFPDYAENYTQRITCAGRIRKGATDEKNPVLVFSFVTAENLPLLEGLASKYNFKVTPMSTLTT